MVKYQGKSGRSLTGAKLHQQYQKKKRELGRPPALTTIAHKNDNVIKKSIRIQGGKYKFRLYKAKVVNAIDPDTGKAVTATIKDVDDNPASKEFRRRDIITKGSILETSAGKVRVTNRPGQEGFVNGVILKE